MASDILDVLNISEETRVEGKELKRKRSEQQENATNSAKRHRQGQMSRELFNLIGPNLPPVAVKKNAVKFKEKLNLNKEVKWEWKSFTPKSDVQNAPKFHHWVKTTVSKPQATTKNVEQLTSKQNSNSDEKLDVGKEDETEKVSNNAEKKYRFEKYNTKLSIPDFTESYYNQNLKTLDDDWDYTETRYLFDVAKLYDLRWAVIADNYEYVPPKKPFEEKAEEDVQLTDQKKSTSDVVEKEDKVAGDKNKDTIKKESKGEKFEKETEEKAESKTKETIGAKGNASSSTDEENSKEPISSAERDVSGKNVDGKEQDETQNKEIKDEKSLEREGTNNEFNGLDAGETKDDKKDADENNSDPQKGKANEVNKLGEDKNNTSTTKTQGRTLEDLKERLYKVSAKILEHDGDEIKDAALIRSLKSFSKEKEYERRSYLEHLIERTPTEIAEEESLVVEARKLELAAKKMLIERAQLLQLLDFPQASSSVQKYMTSQGLTDLYNVLMNPDKSKKRKIETPVPPELGPSALPHTQLLQVRQQEAQQRVNRKTSRRKKRSNSPASRSSSALPYDNEGMEIHHLLRSRLTQEQMDVYGISLHEEKIQPGVVLRSQKLPSFKPTVQNKVFEMLNELGIAARPTMPTARVCQKFEGLLKSLASLIDLKKQTDNLRTEISLIKSQNNVE